MVDIGYLKRNIFAGESGGDYDALYGYANRDGGAFAGVKPSQMTINQVMQFTDPSGPYAANVRGQVGRTATPVGAYQVVGSTLRDAVKALGLTGNETFDQNTQDRIAQWIYQTQGPQAWEGWGGGNVTESTKGGAGMAGLLDYQEEPQTLGQRFRSGLKDGSVLDNLALAFNSMRLNPDQGIAQMVGNRMQQRQELKAQESTANRTAQWLMSIDRPDLARAMMSGGLDPKSAAQLAMTPAEAQGQVVDAATLRQQFPNATIEDGLYSLKPDGTISKVGGSAPVTNITTALPEQEKAYDKGMGEWAVKTYTGIQDAAASAGDQIANLTRMETLMTEPNFRSGTGTDAIVSMRKLVEAMGGNPADVGSIEAFRAASTQAILGQLGGSLGAGFSNSDVQFVANMAANLDNSIQGNRMILTAQKKIAQRKIELARLADQYIAEKGRLDANWPMVMRQYAEQNPLFGSPPPTADGAGGAADPYSYIP